MKRKYTKKYIRECIECDESVKGQYAEQDKIVTETCIQLSEEIIRWDYLPLGERVNDVFDLLKTKIAK